MSSPASAPYEYIDTAPAVEALVARLRDAPRVALDIEADSLHSYYQKVCLIQLTFGDENCIVDPLVGVDISVFLRALAAKTLIIHGADYDLRMLRASFGFRAEGEVHDTLFAAQILGMEELSLVGLARRFLGVTLTKAGQKTDWSHRPLSLAQLAYAAADTRYLAAIADLLIAELRRLDRYDAYHAACEHGVAASARDRVRDPDEAWRIKGLRGLSRRQLAFVREVWRWREHEAQKTDRPPFRILGNAQLRELALWASAHPTARLGHGPRLPRNCVGPRLRALEHAIERARELPEAEWPKSRRPIRPDRASAAESAGSPGSLHPAAGETASGPASRTGRGRP